MERRAGDQLKEVFHPKLVLMRQILRVGSAIGLWIAAEVQAQLVFSISDLPSRIGSAASQYVRTNALRLEQLGSPGGPQRWDFSEVQQSFETIEDIAVVAADDGNHSADFPAAQYAERVSPRSGGPAKWMYYRIDSDQGRIYYGFYDASQDSANTSVPFDQPTIDLPGCISYGQGWSRTTDYLTFVLAFPVEVHFVADAEADAFGTVVLPGLGERLALRLREATKQTFSVVGVGLNIGSIFTTNYYWLVSGVGIAVRASVFSTDLAIALPSTNLLTRVYSFGGSERFPAPVSDLRIRGAANGIQLAWAAGTNALRYRIDTRSDLTAGTWRCLGHTTNLTFSVALGAQSYYRVMAEPEKTIGQSFGPSLKP